MATTKKSATVKKSATTSKKTAAKQQVVDTANTRVVCPECGAEFDILAKHEHTEQNVTVIGADSGLGTIYLPVAKRMEALKNAGVDTSKYFPMQKRDGGECLMTYDEDGRPVPVNEDDPIIRQIIGGGTINNKNLFRRWVMSQVFDWLMWEEKYGAGTWLKYHGYMYQWKMLVEELRVQMKLYGKDMENYRNRNLWFNKNLAIAMAKDYIEQVEKDAANREQPKCKGVPYIKFRHEDIFVSDIDKKILRPLRSKSCYIYNANTPEQLYKAVLEFYRSMHFDPAKYHYTQCAAWKDAYKGAGAFYTMQNLLRFHGCKFPWHNDFWKQGVEDLRLLDNAAYAYRKEGWRLFGLMKQCIAENHIDIKAKKREWADAKKRK